VKEGKVYQSLGKSRSVIHVKKYAAVLIAACTVFFVFLLVNNLIEEKRKVLDIARIQARSSLEKDMVYRMWGAEHGGVYVQVTEDTLPNPNLSHLEHRDITTTSGINLTLVNPAFMTRQAHEIGREAYGHKGHITSINPIRAKNAADPWETEALGIFTRTGIKEVSSVERIDNEDYMRLMRPMITKKSCLKCHSHQGYEVDDIRGGVSVSVPMFPLRAVASSDIIIATSGYCIALLLSILGIVLGARHIQGRIKKQEELADELQETNSILFQERCKLKTALDEIKTLSGILPICSYCKNIRDENGDWSQIEIYIDKRSDAKFSHGLCPDCAKRQYST